MNSPFRMTGASEEFPGLGVPKEELPGLRRNS